MKNMIRIAVFCCWVLLGWVCLHLADGTAAYAAGDGSWRPVYDLIMRWVNFLILVFLIVKFARRPLIDFLQGRKEEVALEIDRIEVEKAAAAKKVADNRELSTQHDTRLVNLRERIISQGKREKKRLIEEARQQSQVMLGEARRKAEARFLMARNAFRMELIDQAVAVASRTLPEIVSDEDNQQLVDVFLAGTTTK